MKSMVSVSLAVTLLLLGCSPSRESKSPDLSDVPLRDTEQLSVSECWQLAKLVSVSAYKLAHRPVALAPEGSATAPSGAVGCVLSTLESTDFDGDAFSAAIKAAAPDMVPGRPEVVEQEHRIRIEVRRRKRIDA